MDQERPFLRALAINCTLKASPAPSSTDRMLNLIADAMGPHGVDTTTIRAVDLDLLPGVSSDEGANDEWPRVRQQILDAHILVLGTPVWLGNPTSVCRRVLERLDAFLDESDDQGRIISADRVAAVATVGNEDGAHNVSAQLFQGLNDVGFTIAASAHAYWVGEAMGSVDFADLDEVPDPVMSTVSTLARNTAHLARLLHVDGYPPS
jgi:multimeric flavodoxin WrbA